MSNLFGVDRTVISDTFGTSINQQNYAKTQPMQKMHKFKKRGEEQSEEPYLIIR